jgi:hypothetical protein
MFLICPATNFLVDGGSAAAARWQQRSGGGQHGGGVGTMAMKTLAVTAMVGALPTIKNQLKAAAAMATEMRTTTTH